MPQDEKPEGFDDAEKKASDFVKDKDKAEHLLVEAMHKADREKGFLGKIWEDLQALFRLIRAWISGAYTQVSLKTILMAVAAVIYFVNPFDLISDFLPGIGYLDDAAVLGFVLKSIKTELEQFLEWERSQS